VEVWIGVAHVKPRPSNDLLEGAIGAFVSSVALAECDQGFITSVSDLLHKLDFDILEMMDIGTLHERQLHGTVEATLIQLAADLTTESPVGLGTFHSYGSK
jgi:hypothetical protein